MKLFEFLGIKPSIRLSYQRDLPMLDIQNIWGRQPSTGLKTQKGRTKHKTQISSMLKNRTKMFQSRKGFRKLSESMATGHLLRKLASPAAKYYYIRCGSQKAWGQTAVTTKRLLDTHMETMAVWTYKERIKWEHLLRYLEDTSFQAWLER